MIGWIASWAAIIDIDLGISVLLIVYTIIRSVQCSLSDTPDGRTFEALTCTVMAADLICTLGPFLSCPHQQAQRSHAGPLTSRPEFCAMRLIQVLRSRSLVAIAWQEYTCERYRRELGRKFPVRFLVKCGSRCIMTCFSKE
jgi:hypothetical protein